MIVPTIAVIGAGECSPELALLAENVGRLVATRKARLICGGLGGVMKAACRGAQQAGGTTIGVLPGSDKSSANPFVDIAIATGLSEARNVVIVRSADGVIAVGGEYGTLSEIAFCMKFGVPIVGLQTWQVTAELETAQSAEEAVARIFEIIPSRTK